MNSSGIRIYRNKTYQDTGYVKGTLTVVRLDTAQDWRKYRDSCD